ncbi:MAG: hypothetical protein AAF443_02000 [Chlamydiota bacterium]
MTSTLLKAHLFTSQSQELFKWIAGFTERFPKWVDSRLLKGLYHLSGPGISPSFMKERSLFHLKRLLLTQFLLQKKIENELALSKEPFLVKIFSIDSLICVAVACPKRKTCLTGETILEIADQKVPALRKVETSFYSWQAQALPYTFCYVEL